jgi:hypothetical protein
MIREHSVGQHGEHPSEAQLLLALDGELEARDAALVSDHVRGCVTCRATFDRLATLSREVEGYCRSWPPEPAVAASAPARDVPPWQRFALAAAAAVLLAIGAGAMWMQLSNGGTKAAIAPEAAVIPILPTPTRTSDIQLASASRDGLVVRRLHESGSGPAAASAGAHLHVEVRQPAMMRTAARPPRAAARAQTLQASAQRAPSYYWSLPYSNHALPLSDGAVVMTVRLSRDQLRLAGIPVSDVHIATDRNQDLVRAKVLVGADGLPRAISFDQN